MITKFMAGGLMAAMAGLIASPSQALVVIDTFDTDQVVQHQNGLGEISAGEIAAAEALGGYRHLYVRNKGILGDSTPIDDGTKLAVSTGVLSFSNVDNSSGFGYITYDGAGGFGEPGDMPNYSTKLADFLLGPDPFMDFNVSSYESDLLVEIRVWDTAGSEMFYDEILPPLGNFEPLLPLEDFTLTSGGAFDWSSVGAVQFYVESFIEGEDPLNPTLGSPRGGYDGAINSVTVNAVPLPSSALALMGGLAGFAALRRRKRKR